MGMEDYAFTVEVSAENVRASIPLPVRRFGAKPLLNIKLTDAEVEPLIRRGWKVAERQLAQARLERDGYGHDPFALAAAAKARADAEVSTDGTSQPQPPS